MGIIYEEKPRQFRLYNDKISYIMTCLPNGQMGRLYYGKRTRYRESFGHLLESAHKDVVPCVYEDNTTFSLEYIKQEYPGFGAGDMWYPAYGIGRESGSGASSFVYKSHIIQREKPELSGLLIVYVEQDEEVRTLKLYLEDPMASMELVLFYTIYEKMFVLTHSARSVYRGLELVCLKRTISLSLDLPDPCYQIIDLTEVWCRERYMGCRGLHRGVWSIYSMRGHSNHRLNPFIRLKQPDAGEDSDEVTDINLVYSGSFLTRAGTDTMETVQVTMGTRPEGFDRPLCPGEKFQTLEAVTVYSRDGLNDMSQVFHQSYRTRLARGYWRDRERPILINNWEATFMDFDKDKILPIADKAKELGIELFVLDDGWFGKRDGDTASLGGWYPDLRKLPDGIMGPTGKIKDMGTKFGLWFEPEMVNRDSRLYRAYLDWMLGNTGRPVCMGRHQYVLDFSKDQVVEHIGDRMEKILGDGGVSYAKWDMNRSIPDPSSMGRDAQYQGIAYHRQILEVYKLCDRLIRNLPRVLSESCASGGAKFDLGILYYVLQGWVSGDTDGVERVKIQYGTNPIYPLSSMGSRVPAIPNRQTQRSVPLAARTVTIYFGTSGYGLDLNLPAEEEQYQVEGQIRLMKEHRKLIQQGKFYRLVSPFEGDEAAWVVVSEDADETTATYFRFLQPVNVDFKRLVPKGLNPGIIYRISGVDYTVYGDGPMNVGLVLPDGVSGV